MTANLSLQNLPDTSLKVGLTAAEYERIDVQHDMLEDINDKYQIG